MAVPEVTQGKPWISPNNLLGFFKDLGIEPLKMSMQKTVSNTLLLSYILLLIELAAADRFKARSQESAEVNGLACHYPWKHLKNYLKSTKNIDVFMSWDLYGHFFVHTSSSEKLQLSSL